MKYIWTIINKMDCKVSNLVQNAITYNKDGGHVEVSVTDRGGRAELRVKDDGIGIPKDSLDHVFKRFYRGFLVVKITVIW